MKNDLLFKDYLGYRVYLDGTVINKHNKPLIHQKFRLGYIYVTLSLKGKPKKISLHRLIAECFIPNPENKPCVNHKNGIKSDNRIINLEWCTRSENTLHGIHIIKTINPHPPHYSGIESRQSKTTIMMDKNSGKILKRFDTMTDAAKFINRDISNINQAIKHNGVCADFKWKTISNH